MTQRLSLLLMLSMLYVSASAFLGSSNTKSHSTRSYCSSLGRSNSLISTSMHMHGRVTACRNIVVLFAKDNEELSATEKIIENEKRGDAAAAPTPVAIDEIEEQQDNKAYPIDLPSPILLATSMVLVISSTGSLFELLGTSDTVIGFVPTAAIAVIGFPLGIFLFYAAIAKATAETEEDDEAFLSGK